jgi:L-serine dehydratase
MCAQTNNGAKGNQLTVSAFELFKIGIGPSSSHTVGPMIAAKLFRSRMSDCDMTPHEVRVTLYGSLAWTGTGHGTDGAICLGLLGQDPETVELDRIPLLLSDLASTKCITLGGGQKVAFDPSSSLHSEKRAA